MTEQQFSFSRDIFQAVAEYSHAYLAYLDPQFNFVWVNAGYAHGSGHSKAELIGRNHFDLFPNPENQAIFERARTTGQPVEFHAKPFVYADQPERGTTYWDWTLVPVKDQDGSVQGFVFTLLDVTERLRAEAALQERTVQLRERVKELNCLYSISALVEKSDHSLTKILQGTVELLPPAWQYPAITGARIILEGQEFKTENFDPTAPWQQVADIFVRDQRSGSVQVCYLEERPLSDEGPFLKEERDLINAIAERLGRIIVRVRAESLSREQNDFIVSVFEALSYPFYVIDAHDYTIKMANSAAYRGKLPANVACYALTHGESTPCAEAGHLCPLEEIKQTGKPAMVEHIHYDQEGERTVYEVRGHPIFDSAGQVTQVIEHSLDVTERKQAEQALHRERDFTSAVLDTAGALVVVLDREGRIVRFNRACERVTGYAFHEVEGKFFGDLFLIPDEMEAVKAVFEQLQAGQFPNDYENFWVTKDGSRRLITWSNTALLDAVGRVEYVIGTGIDITERVQAEAALRESERKYRQLVEVAQEGVWVIDGDAMTTFVNPRMAEMLGYAIDEMQGRHLFSFMDEQGVKICQRNLERRQQGISEQHDFEFLRKDGTRVYTSLETTPITDEGGNYVGALALVADITERRRTEVALATLLDISHQAALTLELEPLLYLILDRLQTVVDYQDATMFTLEDRDLTLVAHRGTASPVLLSQSSFSVDQLRFARPLIVDQDTVIIPDLREHILFAQDRHAEAFQSLFAEARAWMGARLTIKDRIIGILALQHSEPNYYTSQQAELVLAFANQAAVAIENHQLFEQAQAVAALEERQRLARDLHDAVSQTLFSASLAAEVLPRLWERRPDEGRRCLEELHLLTRSALAEMRTLLLELRPSALVEVGLEELLGQLVEAVAGRGRLPITFTVAALCPLPPDVHVTLYRIAQEALNNIVKHASASHAAVSLQCVPVAGEDASNGPVELRIADDGCGFDSAHISSPDCLGLRIMHERAEAIGATIQIESRSGQGTQLEVIWPGLS